MVCSTGQDKADEPDMKKASTPGAGGAGLVAAEVSGWVGAGYSTSADVDAPDLLNANCQSGVMAQITGWLKAEATKEWSPLTNFDTDAEIYVIPHSFDSYKGPTVNLGVDHAADVADMTSVKTVTTDEVHYSGTLAALLTGVGNKSYLEHPQSDHTEKISADFPVKTTCWEPKKCWTCCTKAVHLMEALYKLPLDSDEACFSLGSTLPALLIVGTTSVGVAACDSSGSEQKKTPVSHI